MKTVSMLLIMLTCTQVFAEQVLLATLVSKKTEHHCFLNICAGVTERYYTEQGNSLTIERGEVYSTVTVLDPNNKTLQSVWMFNNVDAEMILKMNTFKKCPMNIIVDGRSFFVQKHEACQSYY